MSEFLSRSALILGDEGIEKLKVASVAVFGVGGVGGHAAEALARGGVGKIDLFDADVVSVSNLNRQIVALRSTVGKSKAAVMRDRILDINPDCIVQAHEVFYSRENAEDFDLASYDYIIDAIDTVKSKLELIVRAKAAGVKIISSMGAGGKLDPTAFTVADIYDTSVCPLAKVVRGELRRLGVKNLKVVYSKEAPIKACVEGEFSRQATGSVSFVPSVVGLIMAGEVIKDIISKKID